jgi:hypothetical protein
MSAGWASLIILFMLFRALNSYKNTHFSTKKCQKNTSSCKKGSFFPFLYNFVGKNQQKL